MTAVGEFEQLLSVGVDKQALVYERNDRDAGEYFFWEYLPEEAAEGNNAGAYTMRFINRRPEGSDHMELTRLSATVFVTEDPEGQKKYIELDMRVETVGHPLMSVSLTHRQEDPAVCAFVTFEGNVARMHRLDWDGNSVTVDQGVVDEETQTDVLSWFAYGVGQFVGFMHDGRSHAKPRDETST